MLYTFGTETTFSYGVIRAGYSKNSVASKAPRFVHGSEGASLEATTLHRENCSEGSLKTEHEQSKICSPYDEEECSHHDVVCCITSPCGKRLAVITAYSVLVFSAGRYRVLLARLTRSSTTRNYGPHVAPAIWSYDSSLLYVLTAQRQALCLYRLGSVLRSLQKNPLKEPRFLIAGASVQLPQAATSPSSPSQPLRLDISLSDNEDDGVDSPDEVNHTQQQQPPTAPATDRNKDALGILGMLSPVGSWHGMRARGRKYLMVSRRENFFLRKRRWELTFVAVVHLVLPAASMQIALSSLVFAAQKGPFILFTSSWRLSTVENWICLGDFVVQLPKHTSQESVKTQTREHQENGDQKRAATHESYRLDHCVAKQHWWLSDSVLHSSDTTDCLGTSELTSKGSERHPKSLSFPCKFIEGLFLVSRVTDAESLTGHLKSRTKLDTNFCKMEDHDVFIEALKQEQKEWASTSNINLKKQPSDSPRVRRTEKNERDPQDIRFVELNESLDLFAVVCCSGVSALLSWKQPFVVTASAVRTPCLDTKTLSTNSVVLDSHCDFVLSPRARSPIGVRLERLGVHSIRLNRPKRLAALALQNGTVELVPLNGLVTEKHLTEGRVCIQTTVLKFPGYSNYPAKIYGPSRSPNVKWSHNGEALVANWRTMGVAVFSYTGSPLFIPSKFSLPLHLKMRSNCRHQSKKYSQAYSSASSHCDTASTLTEQGATQRACSSELSGRSLNLEFFASDVADGNQRCCSCVALDVEWASMDLSLVVFYAAYEWDRVATEYSFYISGSAGVIAGTAGSLGLYFGSPSAAKSTRVLIGANDILFQECLPWKAGGNKWYSARLPSPGYIKNNWPLRLAMLSPDSEWVLTTSRYGFGLFSTRTQRWRLFGNIIQEESLYTESLPIGWYSNTVFYVCVKNLDGSASNEIKSSKDFLIQCAAMEETIRRKMQHKPATMTLRHWKTFDSDFTSYSILFFDVHRRLDIQASLAHIPRLKARPLKTFTFQPTAEAFRAQPPDPLNHLGNTPPLTIPQPPRPADQTPSSIHTCATTSSVLYDPTQPGGFYLDCGHNLEKQTTETPQQRNTSSPTGVKLAPSARQANPSHSHTIPRNTVAPVLMQQPPILGVYDAMQHVTVYRLIPTSTVIGGEPIGGSVITGTAITSAMGYSQIQWDVEVLWTLDLSSAAWIDHPLDLQFIGSDHHLFAHHVDGRLTSIAITDARPPISTLFDTLLARRSTYTEGGVLGAARSAVLVPSERDAKFFKPTNVLGGGTSSGRRLQDKLSFLPTYLSTEKKQPTTVKKFSESNPLLGQVLQFWHDADSQLCHFHVPPTEPLSVYSGTIEEEESLERAPKLKARSTPVNGTLSAPSSCNRPKSGLEGTMYGASGQIEEKLFTKPQDISNSLTAHEGTFLGCPTPTSDQENGSFSSSPLKEQHPWDDVARLLLPLSSLAQGVQSFLPPDKTPMSSFWAQREFWEDIQSGVPGRYVWCETGGVQGGLYLIAVSRQRIEVIQSTRPKYLQRSTTHRRDCQYDNVLYRENRDYRYRLLPIFTHSTCIVSSDGNRNVNETLTHSSYQIRYDRVMAASGVATSHLAFVAEPGISHITSIERFLTRCQPLFSAYIRYLLDAPMGPAMEGRKLHLAWLLLRDLHATCFPATFAATFELLLFQTLEECIPLLLQASKKAGVAETLVTVSPETVSKMIPSGFSHVVHGSRTPPIQWLDFFRLKRISAVPPVSASPAPIHTEGTPTCLQQLLATCMTSFPPFRRLSCILRLLMCFPHLLFNIVIAVVRKAEPLVSPALVFPLIEISPQEAFLQCLRENQLSTAVLYLLLLQSIEGPIETRVTYTLPLLRALLHSRRYETAKSVLRFFLAPYTHLADPGSLVIRGDKTTNAHQSADRIAEKELPSPVVHIVPFSPDGGRPDNTPSMRLPVVLLGYGTVAIETCDFDQPADRDMEESVPAAQQPTDTAKSSNLWRLEPLRAYVLVEIELLQTIIDSVMQFQWLRLATLVAALELDLPAWLQLAQCCLRQFMEKLDHEIHLSCSPLCDNLPPIPTGRTKSATPTPSSPQNSNRSVPQSNRSQPRNACAWRMMAGRFGSRDILNDASRSIQPDLPSSSPFVTYDGSQPQQSCDAWPAWVQYTCECHYCKNAPRISGICCFIRLIESFEQQFDCLGLSFRNEFRRHFSLALGTNPLDTARPHLRHTTIPLSNAINDINQGITVERYPLRSPISGSPSECSASPDSAYTKEVQRSLSTTITLLPTEETSAPHYQDMSYTHASKADASRSLESFILRTPSTAQGSVVELNKGGARLRFCAPVHARQTHSVASKAAENSCDSSIALCDISPTGNLRTKNTTAHPNFYDPFSASPTSSLASSTSSTFSAIHFTPAITEEDEESDYHKQSKTPSVYYTPGAQSETYHQSPSSDTLATLPSQTPEMLADLPLETKAIPPKRPSSDHPACTESKASASRPRSVSVFNDTKIPPKITHVQHASASRAFPSANSSLESHSSTQRFLHSIFRVFLELDLLLLPAAITIACQDKQTLRLLYRKSPMLHQTLRRFFYHSQEWSATKLKTSPE